MRKSLAGRGRGHSGVDRGDNADEGVQYLIANSGIACLLDSTPGADLAPARYGHGQPDQVLLPFGQKRCVVGTRARIQTICVSS